MSQTKVTLYGLSTCAACKQAMRFFKENKVDFLEVLVDTLEGEARDKAVAEVRKLNPAFSFPTIQVGYKAIVGFREQLVKEALGI
jgi:glutaredoxin-like protein NrdH